MAQEITDANFEEIEITPEDHFVSELLVLPRLHPFRFVPFDFS